MDISFRPAHPGDVDDAIPLIYSSGPAAFEYIFGHPRRGAAREFLVRAFASGGGELGFRSHTIAEVNGMIVGVGAAFSGSDNPGFFLAAAHQIWTFFSVDSLAVIRKGLQVEAVVPVPHGNMHYITHLGIAPEFRGQGIGSALIQHLLEHGQASGRSLAVLDVAVSNPRAQALYKRMGFTVKTERAPGLAAQKAGIAPHRRMEKAL